MGMAGSARLPERVPIPVIRSTVRRHGYEGDELEEAVVILRLADDHYVNVHLKREGDRIEKLAKKNARR